MQKVVEQEWMEKHELKYQLREMESMLNKTKDAWNMEQETRKLEQLQYRRMMERVTMKSYMYRIAGNFCRTKYLWKCSK